MRNDICRSAVARHGLKMASTKAEIATLLCHALLEQGKMYHSLYEHELEENIDYWYASLQEDNNDFLFVVTENNGHVAMVLIMPDKTLYTNEAGRARLFEEWPDTYNQNMKRLIPDMVQQLADNNFPVNGVNVMQPKVRHKYKRT